MPARKFRKKPIDIEAVQMPTRIGDFTTAPEWLLEAMRDGRVRYSAPLVFIVMTLEGEMTGRTGDWIIRGARGEIYPCERTIFAETYDLAPTGAPLLGS